MSGVFQPSLSPHNTDVIPSTQTASPDPNQDTQDMSKYGSVESDISHMPCSHPPSLFSRLLSRPLSLSRSWERCSRKMCLLRTMMEKGALSAQRIQEDWAHPLHYDGLHEKKGTEAWNTSCVSTGLIISIKPSLFLCHGRCKNKEMASVGGLNFLTSYHVVLAPNFGCLSLWCLLQAL